MNAPSAAEDRGTPLSWLESGPQLPLPRALRLIAGHARRIVRLLTTADLAAARVQAEVLIQALNPETLDLDTARAAAGNLHRLLFTDAITEAHQSALWIEEVAKESR